MSLFDEAINQASPHSNTSEGSQQHTETALEHLQRLEQEQV